MEFKRDGKNTAITAHAYEVADLWVKYNKKELPYNKEYKDYSGNSVHNKFFKDGTFYGNFKQTEDTLQYNKFVLEDFFKNIWSGKLRDDLSFLNAKSKKRKRHLSEHDGDFDFDRLWDVKLFNSTRTEPFDNRVIVDVSFDIHCGYSAKDIREYGKLCYHVTNFIEEHGYVCDINIVLESNGLFTIKGQSTNENLTRINIKNSNEYQDNITICKYFTDWFYRRAIFNLWVHTAKEQKLGVNEGLGYPKQGLVTKGERGYIFLVPMRKNDIEHRLDFEAIRKAIENAIGNQK